MLLGLITLLGAAFAGTYEPNVNFIAILDSGEPVDVCAHVRADPGLTAPATVDYRIREQGFQNPSPVYTQAQHNTLRAAAVADNTCTAFASAASSLLGGYWTNALTSAERGEVCTIYRAIEGIDPSGIGIFQFEIHRVSPLYHRDGLELDSSGYASAQAAANQGMGSLPAGTFTGAIWTALQNPEQLAVQEILKQISP